MHRLNFGNEPLSRHLYLTLLIVTTSYGFQSISAQSLYFPDKLWETKAPVDAGFDADKLQSAVEFAKKSENASNRDLKQSISQSFGKEPFFKLMGPTRERGDANGMIIRNGYIVAEWGETSRVDMTFSVAKSYLSTVAGLAFDDELIRDVEDPVRSYLRDGTFESEHNRKITWKHLLQQTSDWSGELFDQPDWADRPVGKDMEEWKNRTIYEPGSHFKYNDVRVNLLSYCLTNVIRKPLPVILKERIMDPIGASPTWRWHGYENSWIDLDGQKVQVVSGGGHWGGGFFISTRDHARLGLLFLRNGKWENRQLISSDWIKLAMQPCDVQKDYGFMWWLNTDRSRVRSAPASAYFAAGFNGNYIFVDSENELLIVLRWTDNMPQVIGKIYEAME